MSVLAFVAARSRYRWIAGSLAMISALPRFLTYEISFLLVGLAASPPERRPAAPAVPDAELK
jgi:hypothetical protein